MTEKETGRLLVIMAGMWPSMKVDTQLAKLWYRVIGNIEYAQAENAVYKLALEKEFPPVPAEIIKLCGGNRQQNAKQSFEKVYKLMKDYGLQGYERAKNEMTKAEVEAVKKITWRNICCFDIERNSIDKLEKQFVKAYESLDIDDSRLIAEG